MRNGAPYIRDTLTGMAEAGIRRAVGLILSPHACEASRERYVAQVDEARAALGARAPEIVYATSWHDHPLFVAAIAEGIKPKPEAVLVFTAHSIPLTMAERSPYVAEVTATARAVAARLGHTRWQIAWQSRSGSPREPWLEPDVNDAIRALAGAGVEDVVVAPIGFVADHVEVLYDLDVEARATAKAAGLGFARASTVNDHPLFIRMLAEVVRDAAA
jgi:ferrochelatase